MKRTVETGMKVETRNLPRNNLEAYLQLLELERLPRDVEELPQRITLPREVTIQIMDCVVVSGRPNWFSRNGIEISWQTIFRQSSKTFEKKMNWWVGPERLVLI